MLKFPTVVKAVAYVTALQGIASAQQPCDAYGPGCPSCQRPIIVQLVPTPAPAQRPTHHKLWKCSPPPRGQILDSVAIERVAAPFVRSEMVVSREQLRVVPAIAAERQRVGLAEAERVPAASRERDLDTPSRPETERAPAEPPCYGTEYCPVKPTSADPGGLEKRITRLESTLEALRDLMVQDRQEKLDRLKAEQTP